MHKSPGDLKRSDRFLMAGNLFIILEDAADTSADDMVKIVFTAETSTRNCTMILPRDMLFITY